MSLDLKRLNLFEMVHYGLDTTGFVSFADTCEEGCSIMIHHDLVQVDVLYEAADFDSVVDLTDRFVLT